MSKSDGIMIFSFFLTKQIPPSFLYSYPECISHYFALSITLDRNTINIHSRLQQTSYMYNVHVPPRTEGCTMADPRPANAVRMFSALAQASKISSFWTEHVHVHTHTSMSCTVHVHVCRFSCTSTSTCVS